LFFLATTRKASVSPIVSFTNPKIMEEIAEKHKWLINGMTKIYDILTAMHYISASDVIRPPHSSDIVDTHKLQRLGFETEVIDLIRLLPQLRHEITWGYQRQGTEIFPRSRAVTYLATDREDDCLEWIEDLRFGEFFKSDNNDTRMIPPWMMRLTNGNEFDYGPHLLYILEIVRRTEMIDDDDVTMLTKCRDDYPLVP
jgi:hypothetical protein